MRRYTLKIADKEFVIDVQELASDEFRVQVDGEEYVVRLSGDEDLAGASITPEIIPAGVTAPAPYRPPAPDTLPPVPAVPKPALPPRPHMAQDGFRAELTAPMPGTILSINVKPGDKVEYSQLLMVLEAMKMKNSLKSPQAAVVKEVLVQPGQTVGFGDVLVRFEKA
ncbi:MAG: biotin/lipoyl-containing protein [Chloroflexota bacterium]